VTAWALPSGDPVPSRMLIDIESVEAVPGLRDSCPVYRSSAGRLSGIGRMAFDVRTTAG
jgi:hypothetical protein